MNSPTTGRPWVYIVFFLIGILSFPLGQFSGVFLSESIISLQNALCDLGYCGLDLTFTFGFLFPLFICSILLAAGLYVFKERSPIFALKAFAISLVASSFIFFGGIFVGLFSPLIILLVLFAVGSIALKGRPVFNFSLRAFTASFASLFLIFAGLFMLFAGGGDAGILIQEFDTVEEITAKNPSIGNVSYVEITGEELKNYPLIKRTIDEMGSNKSTSKWFYDKDNVTELGREKALIDNKRHEPAYLFSITDPELEKQLEGIKSGGQIKKDPQNIIFEKLNNTFASKGFSLSGDYTVERLYNDKWVIYEANFGYMYEIQREDKTLEVYNGRYRYGDTYFKIGGKYYLINFMHGD